MDKSEVDNDNVFYENFQIPFNLHSTLLSFNSK